MTNPERLSQTNNTAEQADLTHLRELVLSWYPDEELEFGYKIGNDAAMLTLDEILQICGHKIAPLPEDTLKSLFDKYRGYAEIIHRNGKEMIESTRAIGQAVLERYQ